MSYQIKYLSLQKSELEYEVAVRGGTIGESVQELRKQIVKLSPLLPAEDILESHLDPSADLAQVRETLSKTRDNIISLQSKYDRNGYSRTENMLHHVYYRLIRVDRSEAIEATYSELSKAFKQQFSELKALKKEPSSGSMSSEPLSDIISVSCEKRLISDVVSKLKYSGKTCVRAFVQKAEELAISRGMSKDKLLSFGYEIFTDAALHWYRCARGRVQSWEDLVKLLIQDFSQANYDYLWMDEIRKRTQGEQENITIYVSIMQGMFSRLAKQPSEEEKLEILLHNIRPVYASTLAASSNVSSIQGLQDLCRSYENIQSRLAHFHEPPKADSDTLAREFAYDRQLPSSSSNRAGASYNCSDSDYKSSNYRNRFFKSYPNNTNQYTKKNTERPNSANVNAIEANNSSDSKNSYCPRCRVTSHSLKTCRQPHFLICFKCGKKGVRFPDCTNCQSAVQKN
ncbi:uncharacterized protein LOC125234728 [Leguminivora glycinivorella]|uniref:uncharacterized protein LOC125234728 n=1 Tax=Leguminivora glycinivorella TaxID=1035111 RepID=UPI00200D1B0F|nr:uncharacterized protein LOC125234728 [Leguminivora glycinivorella]XP_047997061.1 uncharacterized protein LOC125234728 [Leguminivora glycinivorella]